MNELDILRLGGRGEGVAETPSGRVYVPFALPGDRVRAQIEGERARLIEILTPGPDRVAPFCEHFGVCGGCAVQELAPRAYAEWKRDLVVEAFARAGLTPEVAPLVDASGSGRRRATFHARFGDGAAHVGFMKAREHEIVEIEACPLLSREMAGALAAARALASALKDLAKPLDILITATLTGLDVDLRGAGPLSKARRARLADATLALGLARLSNHGELVLSREAPRLAIGRAQVALPPGVFLQPTETGEAALFEAASAALSGASAVADLFAGVGAFALRLAELARVTAADLDAPALAALGKAARETQGLKPVATQVRDLFRHPFAPAELAAFDAVVFDPPRAGAQAQARALAASAVQTIVAVSCAPATLARDAALLVAGGYELGRVVPIDQFPASPHVEAVAAFRKKGPRRRGRLLG